MSWRILGGAAAVATGAACIYFLFCVMPFSSWAQPTQKQLDYEMLNQWRKEIVRLQYTDFCAAVKPLSPQAMQVMKQVIEQGKEAKHPVADELEQFFGGLYAKYAERGCGDA